MLPSAFFNLKPNSPELVFRRRLCWYVLGVVGILGVLELGLHLVPPGMRELRGRFLMGLHVLEARQHKPPILVVGTSMSLNMLSPRLMAQHLGRTHPRTAHNLSEGDADIGKAFEVASWLAGGTYRPHVILELSEAFVRPPRASRQNTADRQDTAATGSQWLYLFRHRNLLRVFRKNKLAFMLLGYEGVDGSESGLTDYVSVGLWARRPFWGRADPDSRAFAVPKPKRGRQTSGRPRLASEIVSLNERFRALGVRVSWIIPPVVRGSAIHQSYQQNLLPNVVDPLVSDHGATVFDLNDLDLGTDFFADHDHHLNRTGRATVSRVVADVITTYIPDALSID